MSYAQFPIPNKEEWLKNPPWKDPDLDPIYFTKPENFHYEHFKLGSDLRVIYSLEQFEDFLVRFDENNRRVYFEETGKFFALFLKDFFIPTVQINSLFFNFPLMIKPLKTLFA